MKKIILGMIGICFLFFSCETELVEPQEEETQLLTASSSSDHKKKDEDVKYTECKVIDSDNCNTPGQPNSNFWWPLSETDFLNGFFESTDDHQLTFTEYANGSAHLTGTTSAVTGDCIVTINVWFIDKKDWNAWSAEGGLFKDEDGCSGDEAGSLHYYKIDTQRSTITSEGGDCIDEGVYGLEQRPEGKYGVQVGPGGAIWDTNVGANGLGTWAWIVDKTTRERLWIMDFNFLLECPEVECQPCKGKITELELQYNGDTPVDIVVKTKGKGKNKEGAVVFEGTVMPGGTFSFVGNDDKGTLGTEITIYVNGSVDEKIHTSCSVPIGPGAIFGDYEVINGTSREGGELCPEETPPSEDCSICEGKVTELELQYDGGSTADIVVKTKGKGKNKEGAVVFEGTVMPGGTFSFVGNDDKGTLGTEISIYVNGNLDQKIHTSCSVPIGPGATFGDYTVINGKSREGGELCDTNYSEDDDCDCDGKLTELDLSYSGNSALITVKTKGKGKNKEGAVLFEANVNNGGIIELVGNDDKGTLGTEITIYIDGVESVKIHTSCSDPNVLPGYQVGDFEVIRGASRNNGELCANDNGSH